MRALINPWVILAIILALGGATTAGYLRGRHDENVEMLADAQKQRTMQDVIEAGIAKGVSQIKVQNTTIKQNLETITRENTVYRDCKLDPVARGLLDAALEGRAASAVDHGIVPATDPAD
ncbi:MAG: hypothetical protein LLG14_27310 [Nocardiaceae bacterium]|nr:hypothetical protein [Nocardiaceae bacterium]